MTSENAHLTDNDIELFIRRPDLFGHYLGYNKLVPLHGEWIKRAYYYRSLKSLQAHRGSYKTTALIIVGAVWYLLFINPSETIGTFRKSDEEAQKIGRTVKEHFESPEVMSIVRYLYPKIKTLKTSTWSNSIIRLSISKNKSPEGSFEARGTQGSVTGSHYDIVLPDDIITLKDRTSKAERERTIDIIRELQNNVVNPGGLWMPSGTPWHKDDGWKVLPEPEKYPIGSIPLPHINPEYIAEKKRGTSASLYAANYLLEHIASEDALFTDPFRGAWPEKAQIITAWLDPSYKGDNTTALAMYARDREGGHHVRGWVWPQSVEACYDRIVAILNQYHAGTLYVEANADKGFSARDLALKWPAVISRDESMNKHIKIVSFLKKNWGQIQFPDDCQDEFLNQIMDYIEGQEPDDAPDALAALLREMKIYDQEELLSRRFGI